MENEQNADYSDAACRLVDIAENRCRHHYSRH